MTSDNLKGRTVCFVLIFILMRLIGAHAQTLYLKEALRQGAVERTMIMDGRVLQLDYTAFYRSESCPDVDIELEFIADNELICEYNSRNGTSYFPVPDRCVRMNRTSAVIRQGDVCAPAGQITVIADRSIRSDREYLLPIRVSSLTEGVEADSLCSVIYYLLKPMPVADHKAVRPSGTVPYPAFALLSAGEGNVLHVSDSGKVSMYQFGKPGRGSVVAWNAPEGLSSMSLCLSVADRWLVGLNPHVSGGQLWVYPLDSNACRVEGEFKVLGTSGYNIFSDIVSSGYNLYCRRHDGELLLYPLTAAMEWSSSGVRSLGRGWDFPVLFGFHNCLIAVDPDGVMWRYELNAGGEPRLPHKIGEGWDKYSEIIVTGDTLVAVDRRGCVDRISFNPYLYWNL